MSATVKIFNEERGADDRSGEYLKRVTLLVRAHRNYRVELPLEPRLSAHESDEEAVRRALQELTEALTDWAKSPGSIL